MKIIQIRVATFCNKTVWVRNFNGQNEFEEQSMA